MTKYRIQPPLLIMLIILIRVGCVQPIDKPTRITANSSSVIDYIRTNLALSNLNKGGCFRQYVICAEVKCKTLQKASSRLLV